jgi:hypothetical protein
VAKKIYGEIQETLQYKKVLVRSKARGRFSKRNTISISGVVDIYEDKKYE